MENIITAILYGILEGITEWLPISSTGHLLLFDQLLSLNTSANFKDMFFVVIQFGAILAVIKNYIGKIFPFRKCCSENDKKEIFHIWKLIFISTFPSAIVGVLLNNWCEETLQNTFIICSSLIGFGVIFIILERYRRVEKEIHDYNEVTALTALKIGLFQVLSIIPGTSRSGATIIGATWSGLSKTLAAELSFLMAIPTVAGYSLLKLISFYLSGNVMTRNEWCILLIAFFTAYIASVFVVRWLLLFVKKHSFLFFGIYRIILGIAVIFLL